MRPSYRVQLPQIQEEWSACTGCELGQSRQQVGGAFVFGEGAPGGVMFIGEGPGKEEEAEGRAFVGKTGQFLRDVLKELSFDRYYLTNAVCCRSWDFAYDNQGNRMVRKNWRTKQDEYVVKDEAPKPLQMAACSPRLLQQIYTIDPVLIVTLGGTAAEAVLGKKVAVQVNSGALDHVIIPGAGFLPQLTPKGAWARLTGAKGSRQLIAPIRQNMVTYPVVPLVHPAFAMANEKDRRVGSPMNLFVTGLVKARNYYAAYMTEAYGDTAVEHELSDEALARSLEEEYYGSDYD